MSISSGSDVTIPMQDSPPPPPSPYRNPKGQAGSSGVDNVGYQESSLNQEGGKKRHSGAKNSQTEIPMNDYGTEDNNGVSRTTGRGVNEAVNTELVQGMSVLDTIPHKPQSEFGPYDKFPEYFISVNQHKKFFNRSEKLSVTKDKRKGSGKWKKVICWTLGGFLLAAIITVALLAGFGVIPEKTSGGTYSMREMTTSTGQPDDLATPTWSTESIFYSSSPPPQVTTDESTDSPPTIPISDNYVPNAADVEFRLSDGQYEDELGDSTTSKFKELSGEIERLVKEKLEAEPDVDLATARVTSFRSGSIIAKLRIGWSNLALGGETPEFSTIQRTVSSWKDLGNFTVARGTVLYRVYNSCKSSNGGCSHNCAFDESTLDFLCTCPETQLLGEDKRTCQEAQVVTPSEPEVVSTSESPEASESPLPQEPITVQTTPSTTTTTVPPTPEIPGPVAEATMSPELHSSSPPPSVEPVLQEGTHPAPEATSTTRTTTTTETPRVDTPEEPEGRTESVHEIPVDTTVTPMAIPELVTSPTTLAPVTSEGQLIPEGSQPTPEQGTNGSIVESVDANPLINTTTPTLPAEEPFPENPSEELGVTILPLPSSETSSAELNTSQFRKSSRAFTSQETSDEMSPTESPPRPVSHSDEIMMYSDMELANRNLTTTSRTIHSEEVSAEETPEGHSGEPRRSEQLVQGSDEVVPVVQENGLHQEQREVEEVTTIRPVSLINDTLVNDTIENATEDGSSETVPVSQERIVVEANSSGQSGESLPSDTISGHQSGESLPSDTTSGHQSGESLPSDTTSGHQSGESLPSDITSGHQSGESLPSDTTSGHQSGESLPSDTTSGHQSGESLPTDTTSGHQSGESLSSDTTSGHQSGESLPSDTTSGHQSGESLPSDTTSGHQSGEAMGTESAEGGNQGGPVQESVTMATPSLQDPPVRSVPEASEANHENELSSQLRR